VSESRRLKFRLIFSCVVVLVAVTVAWPEDAKAAAVTSFLPYLVGTVVAGNPRDPSPVAFGVAFVAQWFLLGFLLAMPFSILADRHPHRPID
jgi:hypothetical protein